MTDTTNTTPATPARRLATGVELIADERRRQVEVDGWSAERDDVQHQDEGLALAGAAYALPKWKRPMDCSPTLWPWAERWWKPGDDTPAGRIRELQKAGALIAAEIDRLQREHKVVALQMWPDADLADAIARLEIQRANLWNNCNVHIEAGQHDAADDDAVAIASIDYALRVLHEQRAADGFAQ